MNLNFPSAANCQMFLPSLSMANNNLLYISSGFMFHLAHSHNFCNVSLPPRSAAKRQPFLPTLSGANTNLFVSSLVRFFLAHFRSFVMPLNSPTLLPSSTWHFPYGVELITIYYLPLLLLGCI